MNEQVLSWIEKHSLLQKGDCVLVAVSGGPDSMALLHWLWAHRHHWELTIRAVHLNHQLRGREADEDEQYVAHTCKQWGIPLSSHSMNVAGYAQEHNLSKQVAARECRYTYFEQVAASLAFTKLCVAHHQDDQVETVLMRIVRGTGVSGLRGIPITRRSNSLCIVRPFLAVTKAQIENYCTQFDIQPRIDSSNKKDDYTRNKIRHHVVPILREINPNLYEAVEEMTEIIRSEDELLQQMAEDYFAQIVQIRTGHTIAVDLKRMIEIPLPLQRRLILLILNYLPSHTLDWSKTHVDQIIHLIRFTHGRKTVHLPNGFVAIRQYKTLTFMKQELEKKDATGKTKLSTSIPLPHHGEIHIPELHMKVQVYTLDEAEDFLPSQDSKRDSSTAPTNFDQAVFDADQLVYPLLLRTRQAGDTIQPKGMKGHQKVKQIFIDQKVPSSFRDSWPLIFDQEEMIWIPGLKKANRGKVTKATRRKVIIKIEKLGEDFVSDRGH